MTQQKQRVWMALSTKLAERVTLSLFIKHFTSSEWHICNSISFLFSFFILAYVWWCMSVCVWYMLVCACVYRCTCPGMCLQIPEGEYQVSDLLLSTLFLQDLSITEPGVCFSVGLAGKPTPVFLVSTPPTIQCWDYRHLWPCLAYLMWMLDIFTHVQQSLLFTQPSS